MEKKQKIIIIGGGVSGLTAGIYAQKAGFDSEIYEKHAVLGGQCTGWKRKGFYIDNCITWMTCGNKKFPFYKVWKEVGFLSDVNGKEIPVRQHDAFYTSELDGQSITLWRDLDRAEKEMLALSPQDKKLIKKFFRYARLCENLQVPFTAPVDMMNLVELTKTGLAMLPVGLTILRLGKTSVEDFAAKFKHPLLKKMFLDYFPQNYLLYFFLCAYGTLASGGGGVPDGGSSKTVERMTEIYKALGGKVFAASPVKKIVLEGESANISGAQDSGAIKNNVRAHAKGALLESGQMVKADYIIASCDPHFTFEKLLPGYYMPKALRKAYANPEAYEIGSTFQAAFEYDGLAEDIGRRTFFECSGFDLAGEHITRMNMKNYNMDPIAAPAGKSLIQIKILQNEQKCLYWENLYKSDKEEYNRQKQKAALDIMAMIEERVPSARGKMQVLDVWTPYTYTRYTNAYRGVFMSFIFTKKCRGFLNVSGKLKGIDNVFLSGQWLNVPGGLPMAVTSGKFAIQRILRSQGRPYRIAP